jgi:hypothetical protein
MTATTWVDFKALKTCVAIEDVIAHYGIQLRRIGASDLRGRCPLPSHTSSRSRESFSVNVARNVWSCRSMSCIAARGGRVGGNVLDLVAILECCSVRDAALHLQSWCHKSDSPIRPREPRVEPPPVPNRPLDFELRYINAKHAYLAARGLNAETVRAFGVGHYTGNGLFHGRVVIPIHDERGALVAYAGRAIDDQQPKYRFPKGFRKIAGAIQSAPRVQDWHAHGHRSRRILRCARGPSSGVPSRGRADGLHPVAPPA